VAAQEVIENKGNVVITQPSADPKQPVVQKFDTDAAPILKIAVSANRSLRDLT